MIVGNGAPAATQLLESQLPQLPATHLAAMRDDDLRATAKGRYE